MERTPDPVEYLVRSDRPPDPWLCFWTGVIFGAGNMTLLFMALKSIFG